MNSKELKELQDVKKLLILQLIAAGVQAGEIEEILQLGERNFGKAFHAGKLIKRMKKAQKK